MPNESDRKKTRGFADEQAEFERPSGKAAAGTKPLHARPVKGEIDYQQLIREHLARFPKILARLRDCSGANP